MQSKICQRCGTSYSHIFVTCPDCGDLNSSIRIAESAGSTVTHKQKSRLAQFDEEVATITQRRGADYGDPSVGFDRINRLKSVVRECKNPLVRHVLEQICVKISRIVENPSHLDSFIDIAGYARCGVMVTEPLETVAGKDITETPHVWNSQQRGQKP